eukprot:Hpha_TRINITY_DN23896_c0_g1::TRINITY_DN23896_c0_g1_i1::g.109948::m.109948
MGDVTWEVGDTAEATGLVSMAHLNGLQGPVRQLRTAPDGTKQVVVQLPAPHGAMALRYQNLKKVEKPASQPSGPPPEVGSTVEAHSLVNQASLNGQRGTVKSARDDGTVEVEFPSGRFALTTARLHQVFTPGQTVEAQGLVSMAHLNGLQGKVEGETQPLVFTVDLGPPHGRLGLKAANLKLVASAPAPAP